MYAIIETGGKQIRVEEGAVIFVEKLDVNEGETVVFDKVVAYSDKTTKIGTPYVAGAKVSAKVEIREKLRKSSFTNTKRRKVAHTVSRVIVSHILS